MVLFHSHNASVGWQVVSSRQVSNIRDALVLVEKGTKIASEMPVQLVVLLMIAMLVLSIRAQELAAARLSTCVIGDNGLVKCFGYGLSGETASPSTPFVQLAG